MTGHGGFEDAAERVDAITESFTNLAAVTDDGTQTDLAVTDLFTDPFVRAHTEHPSLEAFVRHSPLAVGADHDDPHVTRAEFDDYVTAVSAFDSWGQMAETAKVAWLEREMGLL